jgi:uridine kinase
VLERVVDRILGFGPRRLRVAVDGLTAAGKTTFAHELARMLAAHGRVVLRASLDDFKRPWSERHLYDRLSGEGYYRNAGDHETARRLLLDPARPGGSGVVALCAIDPITQVDQSGVVVRMPDDGILIVDSVFALRPELDGCWDLRIWMDIDPELSVRRGLARDVVSYGGEDAEAVHRDRWLAGEQLYIAEVDPQTLADFVIDNTDIDDPVLLRDRPEATEPR